MALLLKDASVMAGNMPPRPSVSSLTVSKRFSLGSSVISSCRVSFSVAQERCCAGKWRVKSGTWALALVELVCSVTALIASVAIVSAELQSNTKTLGFETPSWLMVVKTVLLGFMVLTTVLLMFALSKNRPLLILPHWLFSIVFFVFHLVTGTLETVAMERDGDFVVSVVVLVVFGSVFLAVTFMEYRCYLWMENSYR